jgi:hypothetical protein
MQTLEQALTDGLAVSFTYDGKQKIVEVHAIGQSTKDGSLVMRGFQVAGEASRPLPIWALYTVAKIDALTLTFIESEAPRPGYAMGDKQMSTVLHQIIIEEQEAA